MDPLPSEIPLPDAMPIMVLSDATHFPRSLMPLFIFERRYRDMLSHALATERMFGVAYARPEVDPETSSDPVRPIFTAGLIRACVTHNDGTSHLMLHGLKRVEIIDWEQTYPFRIAQISPLDDISIDEDGEQQLAYELIALCRKSIETNPDGLVSAPMQKILDVLEDPIEVADMIGHNFVNDPEPRQELLEILSVKERLDFLIKHVKKEGVGG